MSAPELRFLSPQIQRRRFWSSGQRMEKNFRENFINREDAPWGYSCVGKFGNVAKRRVNTIFDHDIAPWSNMVLGEVLNDRGIGQVICLTDIPSRRPIILKFDRPEGFGASFVGDQVFKSVEGSFSAIPGGELHPQAVGSGISRCIPAG